MKKEQSSLVLPVKLMTGTMVALMLGMTFVIAMLWSDNQKLTEQLTAAKVSLALATKATPAVQNTADGGEAAGSSVVDKPKGTIPAVGGEDWVQGNRNAQVMLIEYSDLECPFCKKFHGTVTKIIEKYGDKVGHVFRSFPLASIHPNATMEAMAAQCVAKSAGSEGYYRYIDTIFSKTKSTGKSFVEADMVTMAKDLGYDSSAVGSCISGSATKDIIDRQSAEGGKGGVTGTPATFLVKSDGTTKFISGALSMETYTQVIDELLR